MQTLLFVFLEICKQKFEFNKVPGNKLICLGCYFIGMNTKVFPRIFPLIDILGLAEYDKFSNKIKINKGPSGNSKLISNSFEGGT